MEKMELDDNVVDLSVSSTTSLTPPSSPVRHQQPSPMSRRLRKFKDLTVTKQRQSRNSPHPKTSYQSRSIVLRTAKSPFKFKIPAVPTATNLSKNKSPPSPIISRSRMKLLAFPRADTLRFSCPVNYTQRKFKSVEIPDIELTKSFITAKSNDPLIVPKLQHRCLYVKRANVNNQVSNVKKRRCLLKARKLKTDLTCTDCVCHSNNVGIITDCSSLSKAENIRSENGDFMSLSDLSQTNGCLANHIISLNCGTKLKLNFLSQSKAINVKDVVLNHRTIVTDQDLRRDEIVDNEVGYMMDIEEIEIGVDSEIAFSSEVEGSTEKRKEACRIARRDPALTITPATARDLRALSGLTITPAPPPMATMSIEHTSTGRRVLRPRTEPRSYTESPDIVLLPGRALNGNSRLMIQANGNYDSDSDEGEMPPLYPIKELSAAEIWERERCLRKLREELRGEETKLVLLKKLKQSQQLKENIAVVPPPSSAVQQAAASPLLSAKNSLTALSQLGSSLSVTPALPPQPQPAHSRSGKPAAILRGQPPPARSGALPAPRSSLPGGATLTPGPAHRTSLGRQPNLTITPSVTITPTSAPPASKTKPSLVGQSESPCKVMPGSGGVTITPAPAPVSEQSTERTRDDGQTPAQRQAAAKLALRKQLEKTLLQIPPPKPPPPEMHFIPNPSNTEFVYLLGLEHVVDFITKERKGPPAPEPFRCQQCRSDFTPVWKWEKQSKHRPANATFQNPQGKDPRVICEQCVTSNVKKALKAEHTNRLKTAFVKALQQEQEIEQRMANQNSSPAPHEPAPPPPPPPVTPKAATPTPVQRHAPTPPTQPTPPPSSSSRSSRGHDNSVEKNAFAHLGGLGNASASAAAMQALQQQLFRGLSQAGALAGAPPHMLPFSPLFYPYQLAMAQAAGLGKGGGGNLADLQRAADLQRQYLLDMIPPQNPGQTSQRQGNWKT